MRNTVLEPIHGHRGGGRGFPLPLRPKSQFPLPLEKCHRQSIPPTLEQPPSSEYPSPLQGLERGQFFSRCAQNLLLPILVHCQAIYGSFRQFSPLFVPKIAYPLDEKIFIVRVPPPLRAKNLTTPTLGDLPSSESYPLDGEPTPCPCMA